MSAVKGISEKKTSHGGTANTAVIGEDFAQSSQRRQGHEGRGEKGEIFSENDKFTSCYIFSDMILYFNMWGNKIIIAKHLVAHNVRLSPYAVSIYPPLPRTNYK